jgi:hypothetical protein
MLDGIGVADAVGTPAGANHAALEERLERPVAVGEVARSLELGELARGTGVRRKAGEPIEAGGHAGCADVGAVEQLITKVAHLQNDLPQVRALELSLALAGTDEVTVLTASVRLAPVRDPRPDSLVRRLPDATVTLPG